MNEFSPQRKEGESFEDYKIRRKAFQISVDAHLQGTVFYDSGKRPPEKDEDGNIVVKAKKGIPMRHVD